MEKILVLDIETAPIVAHVWGLFDQNIGLNQIKRLVHFSVGRQVVRRSGLESNIPR